MGQPGRVRECTGEGAVHAPARTLKECASKGVEMCASEGADKCASEGAEAAKECASEGAGMCTSEGAEMRASEGADTCASEGVQGVKEYVSEGAEGVCPRGRLQQHGRNKECTGEGAVHAPARRLKEGADSANANGGCFIKNDGNVNFEFVTEVPTAPETMLFGMYAWNIYAPLPWFVAVEPFFVQYYRRQQNRAKVLAVVGCEIAGRVGMMLIVCEAAQLRPHPLAGKCMVWGWCRWSWVGEGGQPLESGGRVPGPEGSLYAMGAAGRAGGSEQRPKHPRAGSPWCPGHPRPPAKTAAQQTSMHQ